MISCQKNPHRSGFCYFYLSTICKNKENYMPVSVAQISQSNLAQNQNQRQVPDRGESWLGVLLFPPEMRLNVMYKLAANPDPTYTQRGARLRVHRYAITQLGSTQVSFYIKSNWELPEKFYVMEEPSNPYGTRYQVIDCTPQVRSSRR